MSPPSRPTQVIDNELWIKVYGAIVDARQVALDWIDNGHEPPRVAVPHMETLTFSSGLPMLIRDRSQSKSGPPAYSQLFGFNEGPDSPLAYSTCPALTDLIRYIQRRDDLLARLVPLPQEEFGGDESWSWITANMAAHFALSVLDRAAALSVESEADLQSIYAELERGILADDLPIELVVPLALTRIDLDTTLVVSQGIRIEPIDNATQIARAPSTGSSGIAPIPVVAAATHAIVIEDLSLQNDRRHERVYAGLGAIPLSLDKVDRVVDALRVLTHIPIGYAQVLVRPLGWADHWISHLPPILSAPWVRKYPETFDNAGWLQARETIKRPTIMRFPATFQALELARPEVQLAARRLSQAQVRTNDDDMTVDACIGLEALLSNETTELTHRLSLRAAAALSSRSTAPRNAVSVYNMMKTVYNHRSAIVHGASKFKYKYTELDDGRKETSWVATILLRELLLDILERTDPWTPKALDEAILHSLNFRVPETEDHNQSGETGRR